MALLDRSFRGKCTPEILTFQRVADIQKGEGDLRVELSESELARYIYTYLHTPACAGPCSAGWPT